MMLRMKALYPSRVLMFRYEDLASRPEEELKKICDFLQIPFLTCMLSFHEKAGDSFSFIDKTTLLKYHESLTQPIHTSTIGRWREKLTASEVRVMDATVGSYAEKAGYKREYPNSDLFTRLATLPMQMYGFVLYKLMLAGEYLPYRLKVLLSHALPWLAKIYHMLKG
jgi:hypothetical protein